MIRNESRYFQMKNRPSASDLKIPDVAITDSSESNEATTNAVIAASLPSPVVAAESHLSFSEVDAQLSILESETPQTPNSPRSYRQVFYSSEHRGKAVVPYRVKKIEIKRGDAIDQIKFIYDDLSVWAIGHDGGKADNRVIVMTKGEYITRVTHEQFLNLKSAAAAVEFETNKGRIYTYRPLRLSTHWKSEETTFIADKGKEIISLMVHHGKLLSVQQQPCPTFPDFVKSPKEWYSIISYYPKEGKEGGKEENDVKKVYTNKDKDNNNNNNDNYHHIHNNNNNSNNNDKGIITTAKQKDDDDEDEEKMNQKTISSNNHEKNSIIPAFSDQSYISPIKENTLKKRSTAAAAAQELKKNTMINRSNGTTTTSSSKSMNSTSVGDDDENNSNGSNSNKSTDGLMVIKDTHTTDSKDEIHNSNNDNNANDNNTNSNNNTDTPSSQHFYNLNDALTHWKLIKTQINEKSGRSAILVDCIKMKVIRRGGLKVGREACIQWSILNGYSANQEEEKVNTLETFITLYKLLNSNQDIFITALISILLLVSFYLDLHGSLLTGKVLSAFGSNNNNSNNNHNNNHNNSFSNSSNNNNGNNNTKSSSSSSLWIVDFISLTFQIVSYKKSLLYSFMSVKVIQMIFEVGNIYCHHYSCVYKNQTMKIQAFKHLLTLDQTFFDINSKSEIQGSLNVNAINNLIMWNFPYILGLVCKMIMSFYFIAAINMKMAGLIFLLIVFAKFGFLRYLERWERDLNKIDRKLDTMNRHILDEALDMVASIKLFSKEEGHIYDYEQSQSRCLANINGVVSLRCAREFSYGILQFFIFGIVLMQIMDEEVVIQGSGSMIGDTSSCSNNGINSSHNSCNNKATVATLTGMTINHIINSTTLQSALHNIITYCSQTLYSLFSLSSNSSKTTGLGAAELTSTFLFVQELQSLFTRLKWHLDYLKREFPDIERFLTLMKATPTMPTHGTVVLTEDHFKTGLISFHQVYFHYPSRPGQKVLKGLTLTLQPRKVTAIVGDSGAGKSTIAKLLTRVYDPTSGRITIGDTDLKELDLKRFHQKVAVVSQSPDLFDSSLGENIAYGAVGNVTKEQVVAAAKLANCHEFITSFRAGYDTIAGTRGSQLSGGQKQRIAIARAAIRDPELLVLDEATSALDAENERLVQEALEHVMRNRTTVIIAHRLSTIRSADEIICMRDGEVVEKGTHSELMDLQGSYFNLVSQQVFK